MAKQFDITNCYTCEASFHGYFDQERQNYEFTSKSFIEMGEHMANSLYEYMVLIENEDRKV